MALVNLCVTLDLSTSGQGAVPLKGECEEGTKNCSINSMLFPGGRIGRHLGVQNVGGSAQNAPSSLTNGSSKDNFGCPL